ncbi:MAG: DUF1553 domain-containing protein [Planctomycetales bacterium]|nr:DUF1553 domain-containing protein [Planctomycetales bacterium]
MHTQVRIVARCVTVLAWLGLTGGTVNLAEAVGAADAVTTGGLAVSPARVALERPEASQQLLVLTADGAGVTREATYESGNPAVATVDARGRVKPQGDGATKVLIRYGEQVAEVPVEVRHIHDPPPVSFRYEVLPVLTKAGCNAGGCHGKAEGQNGFRLSIFGFDHVADHNALIKEARGRRVSLVAPDRSLLLRKGDASLPHGGGQKLEPGSAWHRLVRRWIAEGGRLDDESSPQVRSIEVLPEFLSLGSRQHRQLRVTAIYSDGSRRCVTGEAEFQSNDAEVAQVDHEGLVTTTDVPGEAAVLVRYMGQVAVTRVQLPRERGKSLEQPPTDNFVDELAWSKFEQLGIAPSERADDGMFLRRVYLDTIGRLPTVAEARAFLDDDATDKRDRLIDALLERPEYATFWAMKWADILRVDKAIVSPQGAVGMTRWLRRQFAGNRPYHEWAAEIVTARGATTAESPAAFYQVHGEPEVAGRAISQVFLGVRIECAQCHHHPFERWGQEDYFAFSGFFTSVKLQKSGTAQKLVLQPGKDLQHPRTGEPVPPAGLGAPAEDLTELPDRRAAVAAWMTSPDNPYFARMIANRIWAHYFDRGLVEPIDDLRATNPATNEPLLAALAKHMQDGGFDLKAFTRTLLRSRLYQLSSAPSPENEADRQNYSHAAWKSIPAEVLLDSIADATESPNEFNGWPKGVRAIEVWDNRMPSYFFQVFGRPQRVTVCECERGDAPSIAQALHLMNSPETVRKLRDREGRAARLAASPLSNEQIIEEVYLATLSRRPRDEESKWMLQAFSTNTTKTASLRREAVEDILWALLNSREFVFNH